MGGLKKPQNLKSMNTKNYLVLTMILFLGVTESIQAQNFLPGFNGFSRKKTTYVHLEDGTTTEGNLKGFNYKKGLIKAIYIKDASENKVKIEPKDIVYMYLPPSNLAKLGNFGKFITDAQQWKNKNLDQNLFKEGYTFFEKSEVQIKKKTQTLMVQLVNPDFSNKIKVYQDPFAGETASIGIGPLKAGGIAKSYYVKKDGEAVAIRLKKKNYEEEFKEFFGDCPAMIEKYGDEIKWSEFAKHIYEYTNECN